MTESKKNEETEDEKRKEKQEEKRKMWSEAGRRLKLIREKQDLSQKDFAAQYGYPQSTISLCERGARMIPMPLLTRLAQEGYDTNWLALGTDVDNGTYHLQREYDLDTIQANLALLTDDAVHLARKWIDMFVLFQKEKDQLRPEPRSTKRRRKKE